MWALRYTSRTRVTHELLFGVHVLHGEQSGNRLTSLGNVVCKFRSKHHIPSTPLGIATTSSKVNRQYHRSPPALLSSPLTLNFWKSRLVWKRAVFNTLRCLIGCMIGDFSCMWFFFTGISSVHRRRLRYGAIYGGWHCKFYDC
ncbi:hypothetical protein I7I48_10218 [Histoplasma ohiense]|nr:hypothetical protein I7I48_10218 [Histoplasma ohiense (nom. inval.)]